MHNPPLVQALLAVTGGDKDLVRYGENAHQQGWIIRQATRPGAAMAMQVQGKALSFNNLLDADAAFECVAEFDPARTAAVVIVKHMNPCGVAEGATLTEAYARALACDPVSAFGGIVACNKELDAATAEEIVKIFTEVVIVPTADDGARAILAAKPNLRLLVTDSLPDLRKERIVFRSIAGGLLGQTADNRVVDDMELRVVTKRAPTEQELADMQFAFRVVKHVKSNAIVFAKDAATVGIGAGQPNRALSCRIAAWQAAEMAKRLGRPESMAKGCVAASDAFFPFRDGLLEAIEAGATAVIQPGGSVNDKDVIAAADEHDIAMVFTGVRHFRH